MSTVTVRTSHYGNPVAEFPARTLTAFGTGVAATVVYWDRDYRAFFVRGHYLNKGGEVGKRRAHTVIGAGDVPADILAALRAHPTLTN